MMKLDPHYTSVLFSRPLSTLSNRRGTSLSFDVMLDEDFFDPNLNFNPIHEIKRLDTLSFFAFEPIKKDAFKGITYAETLLSQLSSVQKDILAGHLNINQLNTLHHLLIQHRYDAAAYDHELSQLISDIQVRVAVEIAKYNFKKDV